MIRNIIVPEHIGAYYIFSKRIVGIDIGKTEIYATISLASGSKRKIISIIEQKIESNDSISYEERLISALEILKSKLGKYDKIYLSLSSSLVIFKELTIPFLGLNKIKMIVPFEVESLLPFNLEQAAIDCIITKQDNILKQTDVLVAAIKKDSIIQYLDLFTKAGINVDKITVDMFELYGLYKDVPTYAQSDQSFALVDIGLHTTRLAIIIEGQLKYIRVLPKGVFSIAKHETNTLSQLDLENDTSSAQVINNLLKEIQFTLEAYSAKTGSKNKIENILLSGLCTGIPNVIQFVSNTLKIKTEIFEPKNIVRNGKITSNVLHIPNSFLVSVATSLAPETTQQFNLLREKDEQKEELLIKKQLIYLFSLTALILASFSVYSYLKIKSFKNKINAAEQEALTELKKKFKLKNINSLSSANKKAQQELHQQENAWHQLSIENRYSFLQYLSELTKCIKPKDIQLDLTSMNIMDNKIKLYGSVPGYNQLVKLQNQLKCPLIKDVPKLHEYNFKSDPIILTITKNEDI